MRLQLDDGDIVDARIKGKRLRPVCGDSVKAEKIVAEKDWLITHIGERRNQLTRPNTRGDVEVLAANIDAVVVVAAIEPRPDWFIVDRYLCAAELMHTKALVVFNKTDLNPIQASDLDVLADYQSIGLQTIHCSATDGSGLAALEGALGICRAIVVGQSGVGKSSIINCLTSGAQQKTSEVSSKSREGRHTTVNSVMITMNNGGSLIDSPGVRDYAPALQDSNDAAAGFREIEAAAHNCRFANCRHLREPGCAVKDAVETGEISARRYESFKRVINLTESLQSGRY